MFPSHTHEHSCSISSVSLISTSLTLCTNQKVFEPRRPQVVLVGSLDSLHSKQCYCLNTSVPELPNPSVHTCSFTEGWKRALEPLLPSLGLRHYVWRTSTGWQLCLHYTVRLQYRRWLGFLDKTRNILTHATKTRDEFSWCQGIQTAHKETENQ